MREILFRGKHTRTGEWVEGLLWKKKYNDNKLFISCFPDKDDNEEIYIIIPETVGQYTGLTDKDGKKIFEGDICQTKGFPLIDEKPFVVEWNSDECSFYWRDAEGTDGFTIGCSECTTVISNIHDNPELLKGE